MPTGIGHLGIGLLGIGHFGIGFVLAASAGCGTVCDGPGCEDFYARGRLSALPLPERDDGDPNAPPIVLDVWADAAPRYDGAPAHGADWSVAFVPGGTEVAPAVVVGLPEAGQVLRLPLAGAGDEDLGDVDPVWSGPRGGHFGADVLVVVTDAETGAYDLWVGGPDLLAGAGQVSLYRDAHLDEARGDADLVIGGIGPVDALGTRLFRCADLTGDGRDEVALAAPGFSALAPGRWPTSPPPEVQDLAGAVVLVRSERADLHQGAAEALDVGAVWWGEDLAEGVGAAVACDRDLDGDDRPDVAIGAPWWDNGRGRVHIVSGAELPEHGPLGTSGPGAGQAVASRALTDPERDESWFGMAVVAVDLPLGPPQLAVGAPGAEGGDGKVYLFDPAAAPGGAVAASWVAGSGRTGDHVGRTLAVGDVDGDGLHDLVIGAQDYRDDNPKSFDTGGVFVWTDARWLAAGLDTDVTAAPYQVAGTQPFQRTGRRIVAGDADGDGRDELWLPTRTRGVVPRER